MFNNVEFAEAVIDTFAVMSPAGCDRVHLVFSVYQIAAQHIYARCNVYEMKTHRFIRDFNLCIDIDNNLPRDYNLYSMFADVNDFFIKCCRYYNPSGDMKTELYSRSGYSWRHYDGTFAADALLLAFEEDGFDDAEELREANSRFDYDFYYGVYNR